MGNYENEIFGFGNESNEELEQANNFGYDSISGLGESDYENEDLFNVEVDSTESDDSGTNSDFRIGGFENYVELPTENYYNPEINTGIENSTFVPEVSEFLMPTFDENVNEVSDVQPQEVEVNGIDNSESLNWNEQIEQQPFETLKEAKLSDEQIDFNLQLEEENDIEKNDVEDKVEDVVEQETSVELEPELENSEESLELQPVEADETVNEIPISDTPIEEMQALTEYKEEKIEETDINSLFDRVSVNVKDASDIFRKNTDLKQKIDTRFEELKKLQSEIENSRKKQIDEINAYKDEVYGKLTEKKEEIEKRLNLLKETQAAFEKEKQEFEQYRKEEKENIERVQKEVQSAYDDRREELGHIEDVLRKQKDALDEERNQLSLDRIEYEADKNELANNLLKFNELVNTFTTGVGGIKE